MARHFVRVNSQYLNIGSVPVSAVPLTFACWVNLTQSPSGIPDHFAYMSITDGSTSNFFTLYNNKNDPRLEFKSDGSGTPSLFAQITQEPNPGTWTHICGVAPDTTNRHVYLDGNTKASGSGDASIPLGVDDFSIGTLAPGLNHYVDGSVAYATVWNIALTDDEVLQLGATRLHPKKIRPGNIVCHYDFWENDEDRQGGYNLTAVNNPTWADGPPIVF